MLSRPTDATAVRGPLAPGDHSLALEFGGRRRTFLVHVPPHAVAHHPSLLPLPSPLALPLPLPLSLPLPLPLPLPLVVSFHGGLSNARRQQLYSGMDSTADRHGFVVVYPDGTGGTERQRKLLTFNAGRCCPPASRNSVDDVGFTEAILDLLGRLVPIDGRRIYATGMSNGGMMAHRMAADSARVAAVASVAGQLNVDRFAPARHVSVMEFHSVDDERTRFEGGISDRSLVPLAYPPVMAGIERWAAHNQCPPRPAISATIAAPPGTPDTGQTLTVLTYGPGAGGSEVVLYRFTGVGHVWPGAAASYPRLLGRATSLVDANEVMWRFFSAHPRPPG